MRYEGVTEVEWAQLATWLDSDGCISILKSKPVASRHEVNATYHPRIQVYNSALCVMEWLQERFNGTVVNPKRRSHEHKQQRVWTCATADQVALLKGALTHFLVKQDRALLLVSYHENMLWTGKARKGRGRATVMPPEEVSRREALYKRIHVLNQLGPVDESN